MSDRESREIVNQFRTRMDAHRDEDLLNKYEQENDAKSIFIFANSSAYFTGGGQRCTQLAKTFSGMGYKT